MRFAFIQHTWSESPGPMYLSGILRHHGHETTCFIPSAEPAFLRELKKWNPDILGFSLTSGEIPWAREIITELKQAFGIPIILGGPHPTFFPEFIREDSVDYLCVGEGEEVLLEFVQALEAGHKPENIRGLCMKRGKEIIFTPPRQLPRNLDLYPPSDRSLYKRYSSLYHNPHKHIIAGRGCPFDCNYCHNHLLFKIYGRDCYRLPSHERVFQEIEQIMAVGKIELLDFADDTFTAKKAWLMPFLDEYASRIKLPFICNIHAKCVSAEIAQALGKAGCWRVCIGVESGSERIRNTILGKNISDEELFTAARLMHDNKIVILANNMMGIPTETIEDAWKTVDINIKMKIDFPWISLLQPFPRTRIEKICKELGLLDSGKNDFNPTFFEESPIRQSNIKELVRIQKLFWFAVSFPLLRPLWKLLSKLPITPFLHFLFLLSFGWRYMKSNRFSLWNMLVFAWQNRHLYLSMPTPFKRSHAVNDTIPAKENVQ